MPSHRIKTLTPEQFDRAHELRHSLRLMFNGKPKKTLMDPRRIAKQMGVSEAAVRRALGLERPSCGMLGQASRGMQKPAAVVPPDVLAERDRAMNEELSLSAVAFGDPPFSRSALGKLHENKRQEAQKRQSREEWAFTTRSDREAGADRRENAA